MARKIKFALEMRDGAKVRNSLEELREHFDLEKAVGYFLSGKLTEWLEDRYYEDEAEALDAIDKDAPDLRARLCEALGVECADDEDLDVAALERLNEKKAVLRQKTSDEAIIANADKTALTQEDLADLLDMDEPVIYLCGDSFNIPARVKNKKYVGVLGTPTITIKANSQEDLDEKGIVFENVKLPWVKEESKSEGTKACPKCATQNPAVAKFCIACGAPMNGAVSSISESGENATANQAQIAALSDDEEFVMLQELYNNIFGTMQYGAETYKFDKWMFVDDTNTACTSRGVYTSTKNSVTDVQKKMCLKIVCNNMYKDSDIIHAHMNSTGSYGWMFTNDSFCVGGGDLQKVIIKYKDIREIDFERYDGSMEIKTSNGGYSLDWCGADILRAFGSEISEFLLAASALVSDMQQEEQAED